MVGCVIPSFEQYRYVRELRKQHRMQQRLLERQRQQQREVEEQTQQTQQKQQQQEQVVSNTIVEKEHQSRGGASGSVDTETNEGFVATNPTINSCSPSTVLSTTGTSRSSSTECSQLSRRRNNSTWWLSKNVFATKIPRANTNRQSEESSSVAKEETVKQFSFAHPDEIVIETKNNPLNSRSTLYPALQMKEVTKRRMSKPENRNVNSQQTILKSPAPPSQNSESSTTTRGTKRNNNTMIRGQYLSWKAPFADMTDSDGTLSPSPKKKRKTNGSDDDTLSNTSSKRRNWFLPNVKRRRKLQQSKLSFTPLK